MSTHSSRSLYLILFLFLSVHPLEAAPAFTPFLAEAIVDSVNVRAGQSKNFERICQLDKGEEIVVLDKEYSWFKVQLPSKAKVFISDKYLLKRRSDQGQVTANNVNLRAGADINYSIVGQAQDGQLVVIKEHKDGWYAVEPIPGNFGWVSEELLRFKSAALPEVTLVEQAPAPTTPSDGAKAPEAGTKPPAPEAAAAASKVVTGVLSAQRDPKREGVYYKIDDNGRTYYIKGHNFSLDNFLGFKVRAEGTMEQPSFDNSGSPLLKLTKIQLIL